MRLSDLAKELGYQVKIEDPVSQEIYEVRLLSQSNIEPQSPNCLYFVCDIDTSDISALSNIVLVEGVLSTNSHPCNILWLPKSVSVKRAFDTVQRLLNKQINFAEKCNRLMAAIIDGASVQNFIDLCAEILENAVSFSEINSKLIAHSKYFVGNGILWEEHEKYGCFSEKTINSPSYKELKESLYKTTTPILLKGSLTGHSTITGKVLVGNVHVAYFAVINTNREFLKTDVQMVEEICKLLPNYVKIPAERPYIIPEFNYLDIQTLLDNPGNGRLSFDGELAQSELEKGYRILVIQRHSSTTESLPLETAIMLLAELFHKKVIIARASDYIKAILIHESECLKWPDTVGLRGFLLQNGLQAGISRTSKHSDEFKDCFEQAKIALKFGRMFDANEVIFDYEIYASYHLWETLANYEDLEPYCHPSVLALLDYDKKHKTDFAKTLKIVLRLNGNYTAAAKVLHLHKATLSHRIERIQDLVPLDLEDSWIRCQLYSTFQILEVIQNL